MQLSRLGGAFQCLGICRNFRRRGGPRRGFATAWQALLLARALRPGRDSDGCV